MVGVRCKLKINHELSVTSQLMSSLTSALNKNANDQTTPGLMFLDFCVVPVEPSQGAFCTGVSCYWKLQFHVTSCSYGFDASALHKHLVQKIVYTNLKPFSHLLLGLIHAWYWASSSHSHPWTDVFRFMFLLMVKNDYKSSGLINEANH